MKKLLALILALSAAAALTACGTGSGGAFASAGSARASASSDGEAVQYSVTKDVRADTDRRDGKEIAEYRFELPRLTAARGDGTELTEQEARTDAEKDALRTVDAFNSKFSDWAAQADPGGMFSDAWNFYQEQQSAAPEGVDALFTPFSAELTFTSWQTDHLVSIRGEYYTNTGGAHPNTVLLAWNFDLDSGTFLDPTILSDEGQKFTDAVTREIVRQADAAAAREGVKPTDAYWENYRDVAANWPSYAVSFDGDGMTVGFSQYEMACYAAGPQTFLIGCDFLAPYLSDYGRSLLNVHGLPASGSAGDGSGGIGDSSQFTRAELPQAADAVEGKASGI